MTIATATKARKSLSLKLKKRPFTIQNPVRFIMKFFFKKSS